MTPDAILWRRLDQPGYEAARLVRENSGWRLTGNAAFKHEFRICSLAYTILCDSRWQTIKTTVTGWIGDQTVTLDIAVDGRRQWRLNTRAVPLVEGCLDIDLAFSPSTNLLPIRRLELQPGEDSAVRAAWLRFPELALEPLEQHYRRIDESTYHYESGDGTFRRILRTNGAGFVVSYPDFWEAMQGESAAQRVSGVAQGGRSGARMASRHGG